MFLFLFIRSHFCLGEQCAQLQIFTKYSVVYISMWTMFSMGQNSNQHSCDDSFCVTQLFINEKVKFRKLCLPRLFSFLPLRAWNLVLITGYGANILQPRRQKSHDMGSWTVRGKGYESSITSSSTNAVLSQERAIFLRSIYNVCNDYAWFSQRQIHEILK